MVQNIGGNIHKLRNHLNLSQEMFGALIGTSAMNVSRYERDRHPVPAHTLLALGVLAKRAGREAWVFWESAGITRADARAALRGVQAQAAAAGRR